MFVVSTCLSLLISCNLIGLFLCELFVTPEDTILHIICIEVPHDLLSVTIGLPNMNITRTEMQHCCSWSGQNEMNYRCGGTLRKRSPVSHGEHKSLVFTTVYLE